MTVIVNPTGPKLECLAANQPPEEQSDARSNGGTKPNRDQLAHVSYRLGRAVIAISAAPIPIVAPLLRLLVRPVAAELQRSTNRAVFDQVKVEPDRKKRQALLMKRSDELSDRSTAQDAQVKQLYPEQDVWPTSNSFAYLATPALFSCLAVMTLPATLFGLSSVTAGTLVGMGCMFGLYSFNAWRDKVNVQETAHQSAIFSRQAQFPEDRDTVAISSQQRDQSQASTDGSAFENDSLKKTLLNLEQRLNQQLRMLNTSGSADRPAVVLRLSFGKDGD